MINREVTITDPAGIHALKAAQLKMRSGRYESDTFLRNDSGLANCRHPVSVLSLRIRYGARVTVLCDGIDEREALREVCSLLEK